MRVLCTLPHVLGNPISETQGETPVFFFNVGVQSMFPSLVTLKRVLTVIQDFFASVQGAAESGWKYRGDVL